MSEVTITGESGVRTIERDTIVERNMINERAVIGVWPEDTPSQRAWALSVVTHNRPNFKDALDFEDMFEEAEKIVKWVNGRE